VGELVSNPSALVGTIIIVLTLTAAIAGPAITSHDPTESNTQQRFAGPSLLDSDNSEYFLGTDNYGRDLITRTLLGGRSSLLLGISSAGLGLLIGVPLGLIAGYSGGKIDEIIMRLMDSLMSFPSLLLALLILTTLSSSIWNAIIAVGIAYFPRIARVVRSATISVKNEQYVTAAEARGESSVSIMFKEILPNITSPIVVEGTIRIGFAMLIGSSLSFLGLGAQPPTPDWGYMIAQARVYTYDSMWFLLWPALALGITVTGFNLLGDGLRDILDPQTTSED
jgi:peptide/nickel transport system permease protein